MSVGRYWQPPQLIWLVGDTSNASLKPFAADQVIAGVTRTLRVAAELERDGAVISASGAFAIKQSDFGITPMSVLGGAIVVQDQLELRFRIVARPDQLTPSPSGAPPAR